MASSSLSIDTGGSDDDGGGSRSSSSSSSKPKRHHQSLQINVETLRLQASSLVARMRSRVSIETLRPLPMFLGVLPNSGFCLSAQAFTPPVKKLDKSTPEKIQSRVQLNLNFFLTNYVLVAAMVALVVALSHPGMLFFVVLVCALWTFHSFLIRQELDLFGIPVHSLLSIQQRFYLLFVITTIVVLWKCLIPTLEFCLISAVLIFSHAFLRDPKHIETTNDLLLKDEGDDDDDEEAGGGASSDNSGSSSSSAVMVEGPTSSRGDVI